ncbi:MAG: histidine--tRNA ligase [Ignavibacteria bacterium]|nr:histidine--tRNA ligase [Ignavibacteria bacterium]
MISSIRGTKDILPEEIPVWHFVEKKLHEVSNLFGFSEIRLPIFEKTEVFSRTIGADTDLVNKEMYTFFDKGGDSITLRPEMTASVVRAVIQNNLLQQSSILRIWYLGPLFRYERPQKGRLRQFHQYGAELIGTNEPEADAEIILLAKEIFDKLGINDYNIIINTLGNTFSRMRYKEILVEYLRNHIAKLSPESQVRFGKNPLRILDSKDPRDLEIVSECPRILNYLDKPSLEHYEKTKKILEKNGITFIENPFLVRGLDYYSHTVFEFQSPYLGAQNSFGGGGRYNELFEQFNYPKQVPAIGFALGIERIIIILEEQGLKLDNYYPTAYVATTKPEYLDMVVEITQLLRKNNISAIYELQKRSLKAQLKEANRQKVLFTIIIGDEEYQNGFVTLKNMKDGTQRTLTLNDTLTYIQNYQGQI